MRCSFILSSTELILSCVMVLPDVRDRKNENTPPPPALPEPLSKEWESKCDTHTHTHTHPTQLTHTEHYPPLAGDAGEVSIGWSCPTMLPFSFCKPIQHCTCFNKHTSSHSSNPHSPPSCQRHWLELSSLSHCNHPCNLAHLLLSYSLPRPIFCLLSWPWLVQQPLCYTMGTCRTDSHIHTHTHTHQLHVINWLCYSRTSFHAPWVVCHGPCPACCSFLRL